MTPKTIRIAKLIVAIVSAGLTFAGKESMDKVLDAKIAKKVAEELSKNKK